MEHGARMHMKMRTPRRLIDGNALSLMQLGCCWNKTCLA